MTIGEWTEVRDLLDRFDACGNDMECYAIRNQLDAIRHRHAARAHMHDQTCSQMAPPEVMRFAGHGVAKDACQQSSAFALTASQMFIKHYMREHNGLLLYHKVGSGKTCTSISVVEDHIKYNMMHRPALVITPKSLKSNFRRQLFDATRGIDKQCTGSRYPSMVPDSAGMTPEALQKRVDKLLSMYYEVMSVEEFGILIRSIVRSVKERVRKDDERTAKVAKEIRKIMSDRIIIIDEVHNLKMDGEESSKIVPPLLQLAVRHAQNCKLILLSATPMFDEPQEIVFLLNLLLDNDRMPLIDLSKAFNGRVMTKHGRDVISRVARAYVSHVRGDNPWTFPLRLYPRIGQRPRVLVPARYPSVDIFGNPIKKDEQLDDELICLVPSDMSKRQDSVYRYIMSRPGKTKLREVDDEQTSRMSHSSLMEVSNIVFPANDDISVDPKKCIGAVGLNACFTRSGGKRNKTFAYSQQVRKKHGEFLDEQYLPLYAPKLATIIQAIKSSRGVVYVYSRFLSSGLIPLALALEHAGFSRLRGGQLLSSRGKGGAFLVNGRPATYIILSGDASLSPSVDQDVERAKQDANSDGEIVKVILSSSVGTEGIDFRFIREVHLLDPWYNMSRMDQTLGRAARQCSHAMLPISRRNVTIYHHVNMLSRSKMESIDFRVYRIAASKGRAIKMVADVLRENSVDCSLNISTMYFDRSRIQFKVDVETSQGFLIRGHVMGDGPQDRVWCACKLQPPDASKTTMTTDLTFFMDNMPRYVACIHGIFEKRANCSFDEIQSECMAVLGNSFDKQTLLVAVQHMVHHRVPVRGRKSQQGHVLYVGGEYVFQPESDSDELTPMDERGRPHTDPLIRLPAEEDMLRAQMDDMDVNVMFTDVHNKVQALRSQLHFNRAGLETLQPFIMDYIIDRLQTHEMQLIIGSLARELSTKPLLSKFKMEVLHSLRRARCLLGEWPKIRYYFDACQRSFYHVLPTGECFPVSPSQQHEVNAMVRELQLQNPFPTSYVGFLHPNRGGSFDFKLMSGHKSQGFVCSQTSTLNSRALQKQVMNMDASAMNPSLKYVKTDMCAIYEVVLRSRGDGFFARHLQASAR